MLLGCIGLIAGSAGAQQAMTRWLDPAVTEFKTVASGNSDYHFHTESKDQRRDFAMHEYDFDFTHPVYQKDGTVYALTTNIHVLDIATSTILPDTGTRMPDHLWDVRFGGAARWVLEDNWTLAAYLQVGSASDKPFDSADELAVMAAVGLRIPVRRDDGLVFLLQYSNTRDFLEGIPIPGVAYEWNPNDDLQILFGVPFSAVDWQFAEKWRLEASYFIPRTVDAKVSYDATDRLTVYSGFSWDGKGFFRSDRTDDDHRLQFYQKRVTGGLKIKLTRQAAVDLFGGYAFDRFFFEGEDYDDRGFNRVSLADGAFVGAKLSFRF